MPSENPAGYIDPERSVRLSPVATRPGERMESLPDTLTRDAMHAALVSTKRIEALERRIRELEAANATLTAERDGAQEQCQRLERALLDTEAERDGYRADALLAWPVVPIERGQTVLVAIHGSNGQPYAQWFDYNPDPFPRAFHHCPAESAAAALQALKEKMDGVE